MKREKNIYEIVGAPLGFNPGQPARDCLYQATLVQIPEDLIPVQSPDGIVFTGTL